MVCLVSNHSLFKESVSYLPAEMNKVNFVFIGKCILFEYISTPDQEINPVFIVDQEVITQTNSHETISIINLMTSLWFLRIHKGKAIKSIYAIFKVRFADKR